MKILWSSNAMWANTGYGVQAKHLLPRLQALGHEVAQFAWYGLQGSCIEAMGMRIYPSVHDQWGLDVVEGHIKHFKADMLISLQDIWPLPENYGDMIRQAGARWCCWFPVDHDPIPDAVLARARQADYPINYSQFGQRAAAAAGLDCPYIPHGVSDEYLGCELSQADARAKLEWPADGFVFAMVAANKDQPSRKSFPEVMLAFAAFLKRHPEAYLYVHTEANHPTGTQFDKLMSRCGVDKERVLFPNQYLNAIGALGEDFLAAVYRGCDCLLAPSRTEGFGIPILEAQACERPVITTRFASMPELTHFGLTVEPVGLDWTPLGSWIAKNTETQVLAAMEAIYSWPADARAEMGRKARIWAQGFSWDRLVGQFWAPFLERVGADIKRHPHCNHKWGHIGLYDDDGVMCVPCLRCGAELRAGKVTRGGFSHSIHGVEMDIEDDPECGVSYMVCREAERDYGLEDIPFEPGDLAIEVGAHVGEISIYLAKAHPDIDVIAIEPDPENLARLRRNVEANGVDIEVLPIAVTAMQGGIELLYHDPMNTGGSSVVQGNRTIEVETRTLRNIIGDRRVKLLVLDCEGAEYTIILNDPDILERVDYLAGEFHIMEGDKLHTMTPQLQRAMIEIGKRIPTERMRMKVGRM